MQTAKTPSRHAELVSASPLKKVVVTMIFVITMLLNSGMIFSQAIENQKDLNDALEALTKHFKNDFIRIQKMFGIDITVDSIDRKIKSPVLWETNLPFIDSTVGKFQIEVSDNPLMLKTKEVTLPFPYGDNFPVSYSVIYQGKLIALFEPGYFACYTIPSMQRDSSFEKKLNTKKFNYHWLIDNKLIGLSDEKYFFLDKNNKWKRYKEKVPFSNRPHYFLDKNNNWKRYKEKVPFSNQPKLFEDAKYLAFSACQGEFGGIAFFYNKATQKIYATNATCATTIFSKNGKYYVLSELGHMFGSTSLKEIANPDLLTLVTMEDIRKRRFFGERLEDIISRKQTDGSTVIFRFNQIGFLSTFDYKGRTVYLAHLRPLERTFLIEIENNTFKIIHPLFNRSIFLHGPVTTVYSDTILINGAFYIVGREREVFCLIIKDDELIKINWNEKYR